jgi:hypothetical protein
MQRLGEGIIEGSEMDDKEGQRKKKRDESQRAPLGTPRVPRLPIGQVLVGLKTEGVGSCWVRYR